LYFEGKFRNASREIRSQIDGPLGKLSSSVSERLVEVDGDIVVVDDTTIECDGEAIDREDAGDLMEQVTAMIGGASKHLRYP
jgi:transitional endoplasmic reticulum ATPase